MNTLYFRRSSSGSSGFSKKTKTIVGGEAGAASAAPVGAPTAAADEASKERNSSGTDTEMHKIGDNFLG